MDDKMFETRTREGRREEEEKKKTTEKPSAIFPHQQILEYFIIGFFVVELPRIMSTSTLLFCEIVKSMFLVLLENDTSVYCQCTIAFYRHKLWINRHLFVLFI